MAGEFLHYYHLFVPPGREHIALAIWREHLHALRTTGLCRLLDRMVIGMVGQPIDIERPPGNHEIRIFDAGCETVTLELLKNHVDATNDDALILYCHSKGVTHRRGSRSFRHAAFWRQAMLGHVVGCWKDTIQPITSGNCDVSGPFYLETDFWAPRMRNFGPVSYFAGNFWWATSAHLRRLPHANPLNVAPDRYVDRYFNEIWVGLAPHRAFSISRNVWPKMRSCIKMKLLHALRRRTVLPTRLRTSKPLTRALVQHAHVGNMAALVQRAWELCSPSKRYN